MDQSSDEDDDFLDDGSQQPSTWLPIRSRRRVRAVPYQVGNHRRDRQNIFTIRNGGPVFVSSSSNMRNCNITVDGEGLSISNFGNSDGWEDDWDDDSDSDSDTDSDTDSYGSEDESPDDEGDWESPLESNGDSDTGELCYPKTNLLESEESLSGRMTDEELRKLPLRIVTAAELNGELQAGNCHFCDRDYEDGDCVLTMRCYHEFHAGCFMIHRICPDCAPSMSL